MSGDSNVICNWDVVFRISCIAFLFFKVQNLFCGTELYREVSLSQIKVGHVLTVSSHKSKTTMHFVEILCLTSF